MELAQIMRDLSTLVVEQGTMLDRIDHNITETAMKVCAGNEQACIIALAARQLTCGLCQGGANAANRTAQWLACLRAHVHNKQSTIAGVSDCYPKA